MLQTLDPFAIRFTEDFGLRWYGLSYLAGFVLAYLIIHWMAKSGRSQLPQNQVLDFITYMAVGVLAGGRIGYCLFYSPELFFQFTSSVPFWGVFALNQGGMASHGGIIGLIIAGYIFAKKHKVSFLHCLDLVSLVGPLGVFFGRLANFVNGELVGRPAPESYAWAVKFPQDILYWPQYAFEKLYTLAPVVQELGVSGAQWSSWLDRYTSSSEAKSAVVEKLLAIVGAVQSGNTAVQVAITPLLEARYPSQLYAAFGEGLLIFVVLALIWRKPQRPGLIAASFIMLYAGVRLWTEQYRQPDLHIGYQLFELTRGQWLSLGMFAVGLFAFLWWRKSAPGFTVGGWSLPQDKK